MASAQDGKSEVETKLLSMIRELLEGEPVEPATPLSEIGVDSIHFLEMAADIADEFGVEVQDEDLLTFERVADVIRFVEDRV